MPTIISASEITVRYGERAVLDSTTLGIQEGERLGIWRIYACYKFIATKYY